jgi:hypothetical protein
MHWGLQWGLLEPATMAGPMVTAQGASGGSSPGIIIGGKVRNRPMHSAAFTVGVDLHGQHSTVQLLGVSMYVVYMHGLHVVYTRPPQVLNVRRGNKAASGQGRRARTSRAAG